MNSLEVMFPRYGTARDVAAILGCAVGTVYNTASRGDFLPGVYVGRGKYNLSNLKYHIEKTGRWWRVGQRSRKKQKIVEQSSNELNCFIADQVSGQRRTYE